MITDEKPYGTRIQFMFLVTGRTNIIFRIDMERISATFKKTKLEENISAIETNPMLVPKNFIKIFMDSYMKDDKRPAYHYILPRISKMLTRML